LSDSLPIQNGLKRGDALTPVLFNFVLQYANRKVHENQVELELNRDLGEIGWGGVDWIGLTHGRDKWRALVNAVMNLRVP
jgi:hypothetical protein